MTDTGKLVERLKQVRDHDWRLSFLAHTSDTAGEAATTLESLTAEVGRLNGELGATQKMARGFLDQLHDARSELAQARKALKPFAEQATVFDDIPGVYRCCDDVELWQKTGWRIPITVGQLRRARTALTPQEPQGEKP